MEILEPIQRDGCLIFNSAVELLVILLELQISATLIFSKGGELSWKKTENLQKKVVLLDWDWINPFLCFERKSLFSTKISISLCLLLKVYGRCYSKMEQAQKFYRKKGSYVPREFWNRTHTLLEWQIFSDSESHENPLR